MHLLLISAILLSGCYATPKDEEPVGAVSSTSGVEQEMKTERVDVRTYSLPEENPYVASTYTHFCPASQGGYYFCSGQYLTYKDVSTGISVKMCSQEGCEHKDKSCVAYMGGNLQNLVEYRGALYAIVKTEEGKLHLIQKDLSGGKLKVIAEWVEDNISNKQTISTMISLLPPSNGKLYYIFHREVFDVNTMELLSAEQVVCSFDLLTEKTERLPLKGFSISGKAGFVVPVTEYDFDKTTGALTLTCCELRLYDQSGTNYTLIASKDRDDYVPYSDPSNHYGTKCCYLCGNTLYTLDADTSESTELLTPEDKVVNYWLMDNKIFYITNDTAGKAYFFYADLNDCIPVQLHNSGNTDYMVFSMSSEGNDYFAADWNVLSKSDFYAENYGE